MPAEAPAPIAEAPPEPVAAPAAPTQEPDLVLDLFEPTPETLDAQHAERLLRQRLEEALTLTFALTRCGLIDQTEYTANYNAFIRYAHSSGLAADLTSAEAEIRRIAESSGASYSLIYSRVPCTSPSLVTTRDTLRQWRDQAERSSSESSSTP